MRGMHHAEPLNPTAFAAANEHTIDTLERLESLLGPLSAASVAKELPRVHPGYRAMIEASPFAVLATLGPGGLDASPRGDPAGFVQVLDDDKTLLLPERRGNDRADSLRNIVADPRVALLFLIPGVGETLRVNGRARLRDEPAFTDRFAHERQRPKVVIEVAVEAVYLHCAKAFMRSRLWAPETWPGREALPTMGEMIQDQVGAGLVSETAAATRERYLAQLAQEQTPEQKS